MEALAAWVAPIATALAAVITAANLGARITGYGFVVFLFGSIAWCAVGYFTDQPNLLYQNIFLCLINAVGIWRWLGREARYDAGGKSAAEKSEAAPGDTLFPASLLSRADVTSREGETIGHAVDAMLSCGTGRVAYLIVREGGVGGVGERLHMIDWTEFAPESERIVATLSTDELRRAREVDPDSWPGRAPRG